MGRINDVLKLSNQVRASVAFPFNTHSTEGSAFVNDMGEFRDISCTLLSPFTSKIFNRNFLGHPSLPASGIYQSAK